MANNGTNKDEMDRESCVYVSAEIQGTLERKKGVLGGRTKLWCYLQGSTLYLQKKQGEAVETIYLKEVQMVRKVAHEYTGTQFEICLKKKCHLFVCPSEKTCEAWVKALQNAMNRKNMSQSSSNVPVDSTQLSDDINVYNEVEEDPVEDSARPSSPQVRRTARLTSYTEPYDRESVPSRKENDYWEVVDFRNNLHQSQATSELSPGHFSVKTATELPVTTGNIEESYAEINKVKKPLSSEEVSKIFRTTSELSNSMYNGGRFDVGANLPSITTDIPVTGNSYNPYEDVKCNESESNTSLVSTQDNGDGLFQVMSDSLTDRNSPIKDYIHPLTDDDRKPLKELIEFLRDNHEICRVSYTNCPMSNDPINSLKSYLRNLGDSLNTLSSQ